MANALLYNKILELKNLTAFDLEQKIGLGNGAIGKAVKRKSAIKPDTLDKLANAFPDLDLRQLEIEILGGAETPQQPGVTVVEALQMVISAKDDVVRAEREAKEAYKQLAEYSMSVNSVLIQEELSKTHSMVTGMQHYLIERDSKRDKVHPDVISEALGNKILAVAGEKRKGKLAAQHS